MKGYFAKKNTEPKKTLKEFRLESTENFKEGKFLPENGFDLYKLPGSVHEVIEQIQEERTIDGLPPITKDLQRESKGRDGTSEDNEPLPS